MVLTPLRRPTIVLITVALLISGSAQTVAASTAKAAGRRAKADQIDQARVAAELQRFKDEAKRILLKMKRSKNPATIAKAERLELWAAIVTADSQPERHALIQQLGVRTTVTAKPDGVLKVFAAGGKPRVQVFVPDGAAMRWPTMAPAESEVIAPELCYLDEEEPCATQEEMDDYAATLAAAEADNGAWEAEIAATNAYCEQNDCAPNPDLVPVSEGDRVLGRCSDYAWNATMALGSSVAAWLGLRAEYLDAVNVARNISRLRIAAGYVALGVAGFAVGYYGAAYVDCALLMDGAPADTWIGPRPELVY